MNGIRIAFVTGTLTGILGCTAANIIAQEARVNQEAEDESIVLPPGSPPNGILIRATRGGRIAIRDEWGAPVDPDEDSSGDWDRVVEIVIERQVADPDVGLQHFDPGSHNHCRVSAGGRTYSYHC